MEIESKILSITCFDESLILQLENCALSVLDIKTLEKSDFVDALENIPLKLPRVCENVQACTFGNVSCIIGRTQHSQLYINTTEV